MSKSRQGTTSRPALLIGPVRISPRLNPRRRLNDTRALISVLPAEILSRIFVTFCNDSHAHRGSGPSFAYSRTLLILGRVCSLWRRILFATPRLWSYFYLGPPSGAGCGILDLLQVYLDNVGELPFTLSFSPPNAHVPFYNTCAILSMLTEERKLHKVRYLELSNISFSVPFEDLSKFSYVEKLDMSMYDDPYFQQSLSLPDLPHLRELRITRSRMGVLKLPVTQLTSLSLDQVSIRACLSLLCQCPNLTTFHCTDPYHWPWDQDMPSLPHGGPVRLRSLQDFTWSYKNYLHQKRIFPRLELPALRTFKWYSLTHCSVGDESEEDTTLRSLIPRLPTTLTHLEIHLARSTRTWAPLLEHLFNRVPGVQRLCLSQCNDTLMTILLHMVLWGQLVDGEWKIYLPSIQSVTFLDLCVFSQGDVDFADFITRSFDKVGNREPRKEFIVEMIRTTGSWTDGMYQTFQRLHSQGFHCQLFSRSS